MIAEGESPMQQVSGPPQLAQRVDETMQRINTVLSPENQAAFAETLDNLRRVSQASGRHPRQGRRSVGSVGAPGNEVRVANSLGPATFAR